LIVINLHQKDAMSKKIVFSVGAKSRKKMGKKTASRSTNVMLAVANLSIKKDFVATAVYKHEKWVIGCIFVFGNKKYRYMSNIPTTRNKDKYKIRNRKTYNQSLCRRGSLTLWLEDSVLKGWEEVSKKQEEVGEQTDSDSIIQCFLLFNINDFAAMAIKIGLFFVVVE
jgi:hypothetical protein